MIAEAILAAAIHATPGVNEVTHAPPPITSSNRTTRVYDSTTPAYLPNSSTQATYGNGAYAANLGSLHNPHGTLVIDVNGSQPKDDVVDDEIGDVSNVQAGQWVIAHDKVSNHPAVVYTFVSNFPALKQTVQQEAPNKPVIYWIADWNNHDHVVPGSLATQWKSTNTVDVNTFTAKFWLAYNGG